ncbi:putative pyridoxal phosphate-dependent aminotransferase EpsN [Paenibacillus sp. L3-i20]|nr:putative pyridoxal phosphate-dependent aminotransferase EpsN [Paenibacillus sp. L3-i20]
MSGIAEGSNQRIYLSPPHMSGREQLYIAEAFESNWIAPVGPHLTDFEKQIATYLGVDGALAVSSGTAAIHLALRILGVGAGDTVLCSSFTFVASANPIRYVGAEPIFIDADPESWNMSPAALQRSLEDAIQSGNLPKAVIVVHLYGGMADMKKIMDICNRYNIPVIEDAAESLGTTFEGRQSGTFGHFGVFSFNGNKIITTSSGGMLVSNDLVALDKARFLSTQARDEATHYQHSQTGYNYRMSNVLAGIGKAQLEVLDNRVESRRTIFHTYTDSLSSWEEIVFMPELSEVRSNRWLTTITVDHLESDRIVQQLLKSMFEANIEVRPLWKPLHLQPLFSSTKFYSHEEGAEAVCEDLFKKGLCLPSGSNMSVVEQQRVCTVIESVLQSICKESAISIS